MIDLKDYLRGELKGIVIFTYQPAPITTWQAVLEVIDLSTADPKQRVSVRNFIIAQLNDTTLNKVNNEK